MKRTITLLIVLTALCVAGVAAVKYWQHLFPSGETSVLYSRYESVPGIEADFVRRMCFENGQRIDVTLLHATDSTAWKRLKDDLNIEEQPVEVLRRLGVEPADIHLRFSTREHPEVAVCATDFTVHDCVAVCYSRHTVCVFHIDTEEQMEAMFSEVADNRMNKVINH